MLIKTRPVSKSCGVKIHTHMKHAFIAMLNTWVIKMWCFVLVFLRKYNFPCSLKEVLHDVVALPHFQGILYTTNIKVLTSVDVVCSSCSREKNSHLLPRATATTSRTTLSRARPSRTRRLDPLTSGIIGSHEDEKSPLHEGAEYTDVSLTDADFVAVSLVNYILAGCHLVLVQ